MAHGRGPHRCITLEENVHFYKVGRIYPMIYQAN